MCSPQVMAMVQDRISRRRFLGKAGMTTAALTAAATSGPMLAAAQDATPVVATPVAATPAASVSLGDFTTVQDLTHVITPEFPMYVGAQQMRMSTIVTIEADGYFKNELILDEHTGTHIDAPAHFITDGLSAEHLPIENFIAPLAVIDISDRAATNADAQLTPDDIVAWEAEHGPLPARALVAMYSGWEARLAEPASYVNVDDDGMPHFPGVHPETAVMLVEERDVVGVGVDTLSQDYGASTDFGTHFAILGAGKYGIENLAALATVPPVGATLVIGGPKHVNASGGPARVFAFY